MNRQWQFLYDPPVEEHSCQRPYPRTWTRWLWIKETKRKSKGLSPPGRPPCGNPLSSRQRYVASCHSQEFPWSHKTEREWSQTSRPYKLVTSFWHTAPFPHFLPKFFHFFLVSKNFYRFLLKAVFGKKNPNTFLCICLLKVPWCLQSPMLWYKVR